MKLGIAEAEQFFWVEEKGAVADISFGINGGGVERFEMVIV